MSKKILIIDDEDLFREDLGMLLTQQGYECRTAPTAEDGLAAFREFMPDIVLSDIVLPGKNGVEILDDLRQMNPACTIIMMTAFGTLETAVEAFRKGAADYILKPLVIEDLLRKIERIEEFQNLQREIQLLRREIFRDSETLPLVGKSPAMQRVFEMIQKVAPTSSTVLICGESGTGKEVVAQAIHNSSPRKEKPFLALNCSGFQETLLESELFGHEQGAFTGATRTKEGFFEVAGEGTLLLDEISEMPLALQSKLLRVLEEREFFRVGGTRPIPVQARIIAATNKDLQKMVNEGQFREDLYYRIAVFEIHLPPLRERLSDIPLLADYFVQKFNKELKKNYAGISPAAMQQIMAYNWPGNIRELRNVIERAMILGSGPHVEVDDLPSQLQGNRLPVSTQPNLKEAMKIYERNHILKILNDNQWNKEKTARELGIDPSTLYRKMSQLGIQEPDR
ncbi:MAG: sigma-54 dependent transcriptional regulator [candidate division KSB1 bacterium]|nr:sigma-54 dependent transcriptional regulator [candidate division KSB1 bacterium]